MKRTIPSEILILDVTSSEKLMWPFEKDKRRRVIFKAFYLSLRGRKKTMQRLSGCTWCVHDVKKIRFASGVRQDHSDRGTLDTNSSLSGGKNTNVSSFKTNKLSLTIFFL